MLDYARAYLYHDQSLDALTSRAREHKTGATTVPRQIDRVDLSEV